MRPFTGIALLAVALIACEAEPQRQNAVRDPEVLAEENGSCVYTYQLEDASGRGNLSSNQLADKIYETWKPVVASAGRASERESLRVGSVQFDSSRAIIEVTIQRNCSNVTPDEREFVKQVGDSVSSLVYDFGLSIKAGTLEGN